MSGPKARTRLKRGAPAAPRVRRASWAVPVAMAAYVLGWAAHMTLPYYLAPIELRLAGAQGLDLWVFAAVSLASMAAVLPAGRLADRYPRRRVMRAGYAMLALSYLPLLWPTPSFWAPLLGAALAGAGLVAVVVAFNAYIADLTHSGGISTAYGRTSALSTLAGAIGPFAAAGVFRLVGDDLLALRMSAVVFGLAGVAAFLLTFLLPPAPSPSAPLGHGLRDAWRRERGTIRPVAWMYVVMGAGFGMTFPYFAVHFLDELATPNAQWGVLLGIGTVASALGAMAAGRLATRWPKLLVTLLPQALVFLALLAFLFPLPFLVLAGAFVARSLLSNTLAPVVNGEMMTRVAPGSRARVQAWASLAWNAGWTAGSIGGGLLFARLHGAVFPLGAAIALLGAAWGMRLLLRPRESAPA